MRAARTLTWQLLRRETFEAPIPDAPWSEDTYEQITDPFDEGGAYWDYRVMPEPARWQGGWMPARTALEPIPPFRSFRKHLTYGDEGWLGLELYARDGDNDGVLSPDEAGAAFGLGEWDGRPVLRLDAPFHTDAALVHPRLPLPRFYRVELTIGRPQFTLGELSGHEHGGPWSGLATGNGVYLLAILDSLPVPHNNTWIHPRKIVSIDSFVTAEIARSCGHAGPINVEYQGLRDYGDADRKAGPNDFTYYLHCLDGTDGAWHADNRAAAGYRTDGWYRVAIERNAEAFELSVAGRFDEGGPERIVRARVGFGEGQVWHYNRPGEPEPAFPTNPATWRPGGYPHYFAFGVPHINWYRGHALFADLRLYQGSDAPDGPSSHVR